jgi:hypothetical protein
MSSLPLWLNLFWFTNRSLLVLRLPLTMTVLRMNYDWIVLLCFLYSLSVTTENVCCLAVVTGTWLPNRCLARYYSHSLHCCGNVFSASRWLAVDFRSGPTISAFRRHVTIVMRNISLRHATVTEFEVLLEEQTRSASLLQLRRTRVTSRVLFFDTG